MKYTVPETENWCERIHLIPHLDNIDVHNGAKLLSAGDSLFIEDWNSYREIIHLYDIFNGYYCGSFAKFGEGPGEITVPGSMFVDNDKRVLYLVDNGQRNIKTYDLVRVMDDNYSPSITMELDTVSFPAGCKIINDSLCFGRYITTNEGGGFSQSVCRFNLNTGEVRPFQLTDNQKLDNCRSQVAVDNVNEIVYEACSTYDLIRAYDYSGSLIRNIKGPSYSGKFDKSTVYFTDITIADNHLVAAYSGGKRQTDFYGDNIYIFDYTGKCIRNIVVPGPIYSMAYHRPSGRLFFSSGGENQFFYICPFEEREWAQTQSYNNKQTIVTSETAEQTLSPQTAIFTITHPIYGDVDTLSLSAVQDLDAATYTFPIKNISNRTIFITDIQVKNLKNASASWSYSGSLKPGMIITVSIHTHEAINKFQVPITITTNIGQQSFTVSLHSH